MLAHSDNWSLLKIKDFYEKRKSFDLNKITFVRIYRAREVKQSYFTSIVTTLVSCLHACFLVGNSRPNILVTNGPGTAVPLCYAVFLINKLLLLNPSAKQIYVESFCRVKTISLAGKLIKPIADKFIV